jgi:hypothetical protein
LHQSVRSCYSPGLSPSYFLLHISSRHPTFFQYKNPKEGEHKTWFQLKRVKGRENFSQRRDKTEHVYTLSSVKYRKDTAALPSSSSGGGFSYYLDAFDGGAYAKLQAQRRRHPASPTHAASHVKAAAASGWSALASVRGALGGGGGQPLDGFSDGAGRVRLCKVDHRSAAAARQAKWGVGALGEALAAAAAAAEEPPGYRWEWWRLRRYFVSLVFTDIQGSTRLWERFGPKFKAVIDMHHRILRACLRRHHG